MQLLPSAVIFSTLFYFSSLKNDPLIGDDYNLKSQKGRAIMRTIYSMFTNTLISRERKMLFLWDFPGGPVVMNLPSNVGDAGSVPGQGAKFPHAMGQLSQCTAARERALQ